MISTLKRIQARKAIQEVDGGFTLIELLIVIVVLGILAAVVVFSLGSVTSRSAVSACQADGATVNTAMSAYNAELGTFPAVQSDLTASGIVGGPYLQSWPNNPDHYQFGILAGQLYVAIAGTTGAPTAADLVTGGGKVNATSTLNTADWNLWSGSASCVTAVTVN